MVVIITNRVYNRHLNKYQVLISHGVDINSGKLIIMPEVPLDKVDHRWNSEIGEWVLV